MALKEWSSSPLTRPQSSLPPWPHPRTQSQRSWVGSPLGRRTGSCLLCSHTGHRHRAGGCGRIHPRLGQRGPVGPSEQLGPIPITTTPSSAFQPGGSLLDSVRAAPSFPVSPLMVRVRPKHHLLHVAFLPQSCPLLKGPTSTRVSPKKGGDVANTFTFGERGEDSTVRLSPPCQSPPHSDPSSTTELPRAASPCPRPVSLQSHSRRGCGALGLSILTLAGGPWPSGSEAGRTGTVIGARRVVTAAWPTGWWLLGTLVHILFARRAPEASRANTAERAGQVLTDPSATEARALDTFVHICRGKGPLYAPPFCSLPHPRLHPSL